MTYFITGAAGFIGYFLAKRLLNEGNEVVALDSLNEYYSKELKQERLNVLNKNRKFTFFKGLLEDVQLMEHIFSNYKIDIVVNLAAQAGVRYSLENPKAYVDSNVVGFLNVLQACRKYEVQHLLFASSSSVYGLSSNTPYKEDAQCDCPISLYAATKKADELMAYSYSHLYQIPSTGLRFFTVYGPFGRPDMVYFKFAQKIMKNEKIQVFNNGKLYRDFTYIDDVIEAIMKLIPLPPCKRLAKKANFASSSDTGMAHSENEACTRNSTTEDTDATSSESATPNTNPYFDVFNIGNEHPVLLTDFISILEKKLKRKAIKQLLPMQKGDVYITSACSDKLYNKIGWKPFTPLEDGLDKFATWFLKYHTSSI